MARLSTTIINGQIVQLDQHSEEEFVILDGILLKYNGQNKNVIVPTTVNEIYLQAFAGSSIESIKIPNSVTKIGGRAFEDCRQLVSVVLPDSIDTLNNGTFLRCWSLTDIHLPESLSSIESGVFWECHSLENIILPANVKHIGENAFLGCRKLKEITLPAGLQELGDGCFEVCDGLKQVVLPETIKKVGDTKMYKTVKKYITIDGKPLCYVPAAKQYAKQFNKKVNVEEYEKGYAQIARMPNTDSEIAKMTPAIANRILKVLTLIETSIWLDYARYADNKNIKNVLSKMDKLAKPLKNKKADKENKVLLMNIRGAFMLNDCNMAKDYFEKLGLLEQYLAVHNQCN